MNRANERWWARHCRQSFLLKAQRTALAAWDQSLGWLATFQYCALLLAGIGFSCWAALLHLSGVMPWLVPHLLHQPLATVQCLGHLLQLIFFSLTFENHISHNKGPSPIGGRDPGSTQGGQPPPGVHLGSKHCFEPARLLDSRGCAFVC